MMINHLLCNSHEVQMSRRRRRRRKRRISHIVQYLCWVCEVSAPWSLKSCSYFMTAMACYRRGPKRPHFISIRTELLTFYTRSFNVCFQPLPRVTLSAYSKLHKSIEDYCMVTPHFTQQLITQPYEMKHC